MSQLQSHSRLQSQSQQMQTTRQMQQSLKSSFDAWSVVETYVRDNPYYLVAHHLDSYNHFMSEGILRIFRENNPICWSQQQDSDQSNQD